jgi:hypothetical protein
MTTGITAVMLATHGTRRAVRFYGPLDLRLLPISMDLRGAGRCRVAD